MEAVHHYEGTVNQVMGDGIMALFGAPIAHEDHAVRACYAALRMQESVARYADEARRAHGGTVQIRVGLNSGEVVVGAIGNDLRMDYTAVGETTHLAARMEQAARPGTVLIAPATLALVEGFVAVTPLGPVPVKGLREPVEVYELSGIGPARTRLQAAAQRGLTWFVGRDAEIEVLRRSLEHAGAGHGQVVAIVGEAGVGKSRLTWEFTRSHHADGWLVLRGRSISYARGTPYLPVIELLKSYLRIQERDDPRQVRERVADKLLTLDRTLEALLTPLLALFDVPVDDARVECPRPSATPAAYRGRGQAAASPGKSGPTAPPGVRGSPMDGLREPGVARCRDRRSADRAHPAPHQLPSRVPARLGEEGVLHPARDRAAAARERRRAAHWTPGPGRDARVPQAHVDRADRGQPLLPRGERAGSGGEPRARRGSGSLSDDEGARGVADPGDGSGDRRGANRPVATRGEGPASGGVRHRAGRAARPLEIHRRCARDEPPPGAHQPGDR